MLQLRITSRINGRVYARPEPASFCRRFHVVVMCFLHIATVYRLWEYQLYLEPKSAQIGTKFAISV